MSHLTLCVGAPLAGPCLTCNDPSDNGYSMPLVMCVTAALITAAAIGLFVPPTDARVVQLISRVSQMTQPAPRHGGTDNTNLPSNIALAATMGDMEATSPFDSGAVRLNMGGMSLASPNAKRAPELVVTEGSPMCVPTLSPRLSGVPMRRASIHASPEAHARMLPRDHDAAV